MQTKFKLAAALVAGAFAFGAYAAPQTVQGTGVGKHGDMTVAVTFDNNKITDIKIVREQENKVLA
ncbi:MAG: FMN-binding protein, partial [Sutterellaceae bacterium]|nr:FMN-binding protein [Sutterellaceae bacterium]